MFHVLNRAARRSRLFGEAADYTAFERVLAGALHKFPVRLLAYCVMPNHWHLVVWPVNGELPRFMHWLTLVHARHWQDANGSTGCGHVYQDRYRAIPVQGDSHLLSLIRYVERNPLRANLVDEAEDWPWSSASRDRSSCYLPPLSPWPVPRPDDWLERLNTPQTRADLEAVQAAISSERPFGDQSWRSSAAAAVGMTVRRRGRPRRTLI